MKIQKSHITIAYIFATFLFILISAQFFGYLKKHRPDGDGIILTSIQLALPFSILYMITQGKTKRLVLYIFSLMSVLLFLIGISNTSGDYILSRNGIFHIFIAGSLPFCAAIILFSKRRNVGYSDFNFKINRSICKYATRNELDDFNNTALRTTRLATNQDWYIYGFLEGVASTNFFLEKEHSEHYKRQFLDHVFGKFKTLYGFQISKLTQKFTELRNNPENSKIDLGILFMVAALETQGHEIENLLGSIRYNLDSHQTDDTDKILVDLD